MNSDCDFAVTTSRRVACLPSFSAASDTLDQPHLTCLCRKRADKTIRVIIINYRFQKYETFLNHAKVLVVDPAVLPVERSPDLVLPTLTCFSLAAVKATELQAIKSELTQIKANIEALLGRLEEITEDAHITSAGESPVVIATRH